MNHEKKYLKYKSKYLYLKNIQENYQKGGGSNYRLDLKRYDNRELQEKIKDKCLLLKNTNINNLPFDDYNEMLEKLMVTNEHSEINLEFINTISAFPIELDGKLSISRGESGYKFDETLGGYEKLEYTIGDIISDGVTGSNAIILKLNKKPPVNVDPNDTIVANNNKPEELVLKLMPINKGSYYNYTPLTFQHITDSKKNFFESDARYYKYSKEYYNKLELDKDYNGHNVNESDEKIFITAADLDDFKNEMIQNIICRHILGKDNENLINYYNYIYIKVNGRDYGGILMESVDGSLDKYLEENGVVIFENNNFADSLNKYLTNLDILKLPQYRFNHSDLKVQNVFYKNGGDSTLILKIADLDKSSITFNGIRFINGNFINKNIDFNNLNFSNLGKKKNSLKINRNTPRTVGDIEFEQIFFRYSFFPPPPFLDMLMLFITLRIYYYNKLKEFTGYFNNKENFGKIFNKYIGDDYNIVQVTQAIGEQLQNVQGETDFGEIVKQTLIANEIEIPLFYKNDSQISKYENKKIKLAGNYKLIVSNRSKFVLDSREIKGLNQESITWKSEDGNIKIFYTGNEKIKYDNYLKTNRYTYTTFYGVKSLYEYFYY